MSTRSLLTLSPREKSLPLSVIKNSSPASVAILEDATVSVDVPENPRLSSNIICDIVSLNAASTSATVVAVDKSTTLSAYVELAK